MTATRKAEERFFDTHDGVALFYRRWPAPQGPANQAIVIFHRGHEHSGRLQHIADELALGDYDIYAWDARGHGRSPGARGSFTTSAPPACNSRCPSAMPRSYSAHILPVLRPAWRL